MSASSKKKLRNEQTTASMTEKQIAAKKEAHKVKLYTVLSCVVLALMILTVVVVMTINSGIIERSTTAAVVGDEKINSVELSYNYIDSINMFMNRAGNYMALTGLDVTKPLNEQIWDKESGKTWADYFLDQAKLNIQQTYALNAAAAADNYKMNEQDEAALKSRIDSLNAQAVSNGFPDAASLLKAMYGNGASVKSYEKYCRDQILAASYTGNHQEGLTYTDADLREAEKDEYGHYSSYSYNSYYLSTSAFLKGGTTDDEGNTTYTDEEKAASVKAAEEAFKKVASATSLEEFDAAIAAMDVNKDKENVASTAYTDVLYGSNNMSTTIAEWIDSGEHHEGEVVCLPNINKTGDTDVTTGFYAVYYHGSKDNTMPLVNVRHILVSFEGGTKDENGVVTYSDEEKAKAKETAETILKDWKAGDATEDSFAKLATEKTTDPGSKENGGLYENITPKSMVPAFDEWCFDQSRKAGDTGIVETEYGYHVMYFSGNSDTTYRDFMIKNTLTQKDMESWLKEVTDQVSIEVVKTSGIDMDMVLQPAKAQ